MHSYKRIFNVIASSIVLLMVLSSCSNEDKSNQDNNDESSTLENSDVVLAYDAYHETAYPVSIFNPGNQTITMFKTDESGFVTSFDCLFLEDNTSVTATFNEDGLLNGIGTEGATIAFSNYRDNVVDIAIISGDETLLIKEFKSAKEWKEIAQSLRFNFSAEVTRGEQTGYYEKVSSYMQFIGSQLYNDLKMALESHKGFSGQKIAISRLLAIFQDTFMLEVAHPQDLDYTTFFMELATMAKLPITPWGVFLFLVSNYDTIEAFFEEMTYNLLEMHEEYFKDRDNAIGALNSGYGELKATLSWNFYADIDIHAFEPSGIHIYWNNPKSSVSGGYLDVDNREGGAGAIENIYWEKAEEGEYDIFIDYYGESTLNDLFQTGECLVSVYCNGYGKTYRIPLGIYDSEYVTTITLPDGILSRTTRSNNIRININRGKKNYN